ncbi:MAG: hypothetical protein U9P14_09765, partial [Gemmatimonadota bacterium]|nr:hypothetical protein [Gemmatimonadota bacterium]
EDFNGDGAVNIADAIALLLLGRDDPSNPRADYNGDGGYMISDVIFLLINMRDNKLTPVEPEPEPDVKTYFIKGMVYCASGSFVNVTIMLQSADTTLTTLTDGSGIYYFNIPDGYYTIVPVYSGYGFDPILIEVLIKGEDLYNQNFLIYGYESVGGL